MSDLSSFLVQNPKQINSNLLLLLKSKCLLSARFGTNNESYITTLLDINKDDDSLVLDCGAKEDLNQRLLSADNISFDGEYQGIKVSFSGGALKRITHKNESAFAMPIPRTLYWLQRREYYRVKSPFSKPSYCQFMINGKEPVNLKLYDISISGFAMLNVSKEISDLLVTGKSFSDCRLILSGAGEGVVSFQVCSKHIINPNKSQKIQKIGCKITNITHRVEEMIQRYMHQIQREDLQKSE